MQNFRKIAKLRCSEICEPQNREINSCNKVLQNNRNKDRHLALRIKFHQMTSCNKEWSSSVVDQLAVVEKLNKLYTSEPDSNGARRASPAEV